MDRDQIVRMLDDLVEEVDYDIWKELFHYRENPEAVDQLVHIATKHLKWAGVKVE